MRNTALFVDGKGFLIDGAALERFQDSGVAVILQDFLLVFVGSFGFRFERINGDC